MNYLYVSKRKQKTPSRGVFFVFGIIIFVGVLLYIFGGKIFSFFTPLWQGETATLAATGGTKYWFSDKADLGRQVEMLVEERDGLLATLAVQNTKAALYDQYVLELGTTSEQAPGMQAKIIRRPPFSTFDVYVVDKGYGDGVAEGDLVYARNALVGAVQSVTYSNATVQLYSSPGQEVLVTVGTSSQQFQAQGIGSGAFKAEAPRDADIKVGDAIISADRSVSLYGIVESVELPEGGTEKNVFISLPFELNNTTWLTIQ